MTSARKVGALSWVVLELFDVLYWTQQPCCDGVFPTTPRLFAVWVLNADVAIAVGRCAAVFVHWKILLRDEKYQVSLDSLRVRLLSLVSKGLHLEFCERIVSRGGFKDRRTL